MKMGYFETLYLKGQEKVRGKDIVVWGMVRNCGKAISNNVLIIEKICSYFNDYRIVIFENNSTDNTKDVLLRWQKRNNKVVVHLNNFDESKYKLIPYDDRYFVYFQMNKLQKFFDYRNMAMCCLEQLEFKSDYSLLVDLDVPRIDVKGVITSFGSDIEWDAVTANGYSYSPHLKRRYHDTFALCEYGMENVKQTLNMIKDYRDIFSFMRKGQPFIRVFSAFGGIAIFRSEVIKGLRYEPVFNDYGQVQVRCEHFSLFKAMSDKGFDRVFINPNMEIYYQKLTWSLIWKKLKELIK